MELDYPKMTLEQPEHGMAYEYAAIKREEIPRASAPEFQHLLDTYAGETNKSVSVWRSLQEEDFDFRPHARSSSAGEILKHQLLSERRFFAEFLESPEPAPAEVLPGGKEPRAFAIRLEELARPRLEYMARRDSAWWLGEARFFDVRRQRIWIFWRRVLHSAHHRTQLTVYLRLLDKPVPSTYGPTADVTWAGADPTLGVEAAGRGGS